MDMKDIVARLIGQQTRIDELLESESRPVPRSPISASSMSSLEAWCRKRGFELPASYREFLLVCDGIENFSPSYGLFGAVDLLGETYQPLLGACLADWPGFDYPEDLLPVLIGYSTETTTRVWFELSHERPQAAEPIVLEGDPGDLTLYDSFAKFIAFRVDVNEVTIKRLIELRGSQDGS